MSFFTRKYRAARIVQALIALPALSLFRKLPDADAPIPSIPRRPK